MNARTAERINIIFLEVCALGERLCTCGAVLFHDLKLELRPLPDLIELEREVGHAAAFVLSDLREASPDDVVGNSFHSRPSRSRPPDLGERPPHCLKKKATFAFRH